MVNRQPKGSAGGKGGQFAADRSGAIKVPTSAKPHAPVVPKTLSTNNFSASTSTLSSSHKDLSALSGPEKRVEAQIQIDALLAKANQQFEEITNQILSEPVTVDGDGKVRGFDFQGARVVADTRIGPNGFEVTYDLRFPPAYNDPFKLANQMIAAEVIKRMLDNRSIPL